MERREAIFTKLSTYFMRIIQTLNDCSNLKIFRYKRISPFEITGDVMGFISNIKESLLILL
jgi:hypothetical protein